MFVSEHFPLAYHLAVNMGTKGNDAAVWDRRLADHWDDMEWPTKVSLISGRVGLDDQVLDIACGTGSILRELQKQGYKNLHGLDSSNYALERLSAEGLQMHRGKLPDLPFQNETFDVVIASQILEHVIRRKKFAREMVRVLKPGGTAFIFVPNDSLGPIEERSHVIKYNEKTFAAFISSFFEILSLEVLKDPNYENTVLSAVVRKSAQGGQN